MLRLPKFSFHRDFHFLTAQYGSNDKNKLRAEIVYETNFRDFREFGQLREIKSSREQFFFRFSELATLTLFYRISNNISRDNINRKM